MVGDKERVYRRWARIWHLFSCKQWYWRLKVAKRMNYNYWNGLEEVSLCFLAFCQRSALFSDFLSAVRSVFCLSVSGQVCFLTFCQRSVLFSDFLSAVRSVFWLSVSGRVCYLTFCQRSDLISGLLSAVESVFWLSVSGRVCFLVTSLCRSSFHGYVWL